MEMFYQNSIVFDVISRLSALAQCLQPNRNLISRHEPCSCVSTEFTQVNVRFFAGWASPHRIGVSDL